MGFGHTFIGSHHCIFLINVSEKELTPLEDCYIHIDDFISIIICFCSCWWAAMSSGIVSIFLYYWNISTFWSCVSWVSMPMILYKTPGYVMLTYIGRAFDSDSASSLVGILAFTMILLQIYLCIWPYYQSIQWTYRPCGCVGISSKLGMIRRIEPPCVHVACLEYRSSSNTC